MYETLLDDKIILSIENAICLHRCSKLLEYVLGSALFAQFCVSGIVLCTSAYQLTVVYT